MEGGLKRYSCTHCDQSSHIAGQFSRLCAHGIKEHNVYFWKRRKFSKVSESAVAVQSRAVRKQRVPYYVITALKDMPRTAVAAGDSSAQTIEDDQLGQRNEDDVRLAELEIQNNQQLEEIQAKYEQQREQEKHENTVRLQDIQRQLDEKIAEVQAANIPEVLEQNRRLTAMQQNLQAQKEALEAAKRREQDMFKSRVELLQLELHRQQSIIQAITTDHVYKVVVCLTVVSKSLAIRPSKPKAIHGQQRIHCG
jgi:hypothetical protein